MKKSLLSLLTLALILTAAACSAPGASSVDQPVKSAYAKTKVQTNAASTGAAPGISAAPQSTPAAPETPAKGTTSAPTLDKRVIVDEKDVRITVTGLTMDGWMGPALKVLIENNSDTDLMFQARSASVNGYMINHMISAEVAAGKKANDEITFTKADLETAGIKEIADMELSFHIVTADKWDEYLYTDLLPIKTSLAEGYQYTFDDSGKVLYDQDNIRIIAKGLSSNDSIFGPGLLLFIENLSDQSITIQARDVSVNGFMIDSSMSAEVSPQKRMIDALTFFEADLKDNAIEKLADVELAFHIFTTKGWETLVDTEKYILEFN